MCDFKSKDFYEEKIQYFLKNNYEEYNPFDFYREMFPKGSFQQSNERGGFKSNGLLQYRCKGNKGLTTLILNDEHDVLGHLIDKWPGYENVEFATISGCSYVGKNKKNKNARMCYALIFDLDAVDSSKLQNIIGLFGAKLIPTPTAITVSGNGVHLTYILEEAIPLYPAKAKMLSDLKSMLTRKLWNERTSLDRNIQYQGIVQGYRVIGTPTKNGHITRAFKISGKKVHISELINSIEEIDIAPFLKNDKGEVYNKRILRLMKDKKLAENMLEELCYYDFHTPLAEAKNLWPDWHERIVIQKEKPGHWKTNRAVYDWWLDKISDKSNVTIGHRENCIFCLGAFAQKCNIDEQEFITDAFNLFELYDSITGNSGQPFTKDDIQAAIDAYHTADLTRMSISAIERISGIKISKKTHKGPKRSQKEHLLRCRKLRDANFKNGEVWYNTNGRPPVEDKIKEYLSAHPTETNISKISRETGVSRPTVYKYFKQLAL